MTVTTRITGLVLAAALATPGVQANEAGAVGAISASHGLVDREGTLTGLGTYYRAAFRPGGFEFQPALGAGVETVRSLGFSLESVTVGGSALLAGPESAVPESEGDLVTYQHAGGILERYEVRAEGIEQSFVFEHLADRSGDLVVRGHVATNLAPVRNADGTLSFLSGGHGGVSYGGVTGIDALGRTTAGELRLDGDYLELVLPGEFVATAELPLILDPLIGAELALGGTLSEDDSGPDVAYDATNDRYLVVWERVFTIGDLEVRGQLVSSGGSLIGSTISFAAWPVVRRPTVANIDASNRFLVVYETSSSIFGPWSLRMSAVDADTGAASFPFTLASDVGENHVQADVGGQAGTTSTDAVVVWNHEGVGIRARRVRVQSTGLPLPVGTLLELSSNSQDSSPTISKCGGQEGRFPILWQTFFTFPAPGDHDLNVGVVDSNLDVVVPFGLLYSTFGIDEQDADVDIGSDSDFYVVWKQRDVNVTNIFNIYGVPAEYDGPALTLGAAKGIEVEEFSQNSDPAVCWTGVEYFVTWTNWFVNLPFEAKVYGRWIDADSGEQEDPNNPIFGGNGGNGLHVAKPAMASRWSGDAGPPSSDRDDLLLVYESSPILPPFEGQIMGQHLEAIGAGGTVTDLGGGCGAGTFQLDGPSAIGNPELKFSLTGVGPSATLSLLNLNAPGPTFNCGGCQFLLAGILIVVPVVLGTASIPIEIPNDGSLLGGVLEAQWTVLVPPAAGPCPSLDYLIASDRKSLQIGL